MNVKEIPILKQKVLGLLPVVQSEVGKTLGIDHREVSKLVSIMVGENLIKKTRSDRTFLLERLNGSGNHEKEKCKKEEEEEEEDKRETVKVKKEVKEKEVKEKDADAEQKVLDMLPITQSEMCKRLAIDSSHGSKLVNRLLEEGLVKKTRYLRTFLLEEITGHKEKLETVCLEKNEEEEKKKESEKKKKEEEKKNEGEYTPDLKQNILDMLPTTQSEMCKKLNIDSSHGSKLVNRLLEEGLIKKTKHLKTFLLERLRVAEKKKIADYSPMLSKGVFSPCCGCQKGCSPEKCSLLIEWIL